MVIGDFIYIRSIRGVLAGARPPPRAAGGSVAGAFCVPPRPARAMSVSYKALSLAAALELL